MKIRSLLNNSSRKFVLILIDIFIFIFALFFITSLSVNEPIKTIISFNYLIPIIIFSLLNPIIYFIFGIYKTIARYSSLSIASKIYKANIFSVLLCLLLFEIFKYNFSLKDSLLMYFLVSNLVCFYRIIFRYLIKIPVLVKKGKSKNIVIYGAGSAGAQLLSSLNNQNSLEVIAFVDDDSRLWGLEIDNVKIYKPDYLENLKKEGLVEI